MERITTGVPGLDEVVGGGLLRGGMYMVMGRPGSGKTTLGNQLCFHHVAGGGRAVYVTLLSESHGRLIALLAGFSFFDERRVGDELTYVSAYSELERGGLSGLLLALGQTVRAQRATLLVLDGLPAAGDLPATEMALRRFLHELQALVELLGCTCLLLTGADDPDAHYAERTIVDGLLTLSAERAGARTLRTLDVVKARGGAHLGGRHAVELSPCGLSVYPRLEALRSVPSAPALAVPEVVPTGTPSLDDLLQGGARTGSALLLAGPAGSGKTDIALTFLDGDDRGVYLGFGAPPARLVAGRAGLREAVARGQVELLWRSPTELLPDRLAAEALARVDARGARRLVIDDVHVLTAELLDPQRTRPFLAALHNELRARPVATLLTASSETGRQDVRCLADVVDESVRLSPQGRPLARARSRPA